MGTGRSVEANHQSLNEGQNLSLRELCQGRENRGSAPIGEVSDSVRGPTRVRYPSRVNGKGYVWRLKAWQDTKWTVELKRTPKEEQKQTFRGSWEGGQDRVTGPTREVCGDRIGPDRV